LEDGDVEAIHNKLNNMYVDELWGVDHTTANFEGLISDDVVFDNCLKVISSNLNIRNELREKTVEEIENITGMQMDIPLFSKRPVIHVGNRNIPLRFVICYYILHRLRNNLKTKPYNALEIGAGVGYIPYLFIRHYPHIKYYIIDLTAMSVMQTYIYATMVGEDNIWFHGEPKSDTTSLHIYSPDSINELNEQMSVVISHNSFVEFPQHVQSIYLNKMKQILKPDGFFYSINWEPHGAAGQTSVIEACNSNGFTRTYRKTFFLESQMHPDPSIPYFEEIYKPIKKE
jgi:SAM-dependent methyltransferase